MMIMTSSTDMNSVIATFSLPCQRLFRDYRSWNATELCQSVEKDGMLQYLASYGHCTEDEFNYLTSTLCGPAVSRIMLHTYMRKKLYAKRSTNCLVHPRFTEAVLTSSGVCRDKIFQCVIIVKAERICEVLKSHAGTFPTEACLRQFNACTAAEFDRLQEAACSEAPSRTMSLMSLSGPEDLILTWKYRPLGSQKDRNYPNIVDVTLSQPQKVESSKGPCILWRLETSVSFTLQEYDNGNTYFCVVYDHTDEMSRENFTIGIASDEEAPQTQSSGGVNVGGVVGGVIAGVVVAYVVIMLVYCLRCKKRCKRDHESHGTSQDTESRDNVNAETKKSSKVKCSSIFSFLKSKMSQEKETGKGGQIQGYNIPKRVSVKDSTVSLDSPTYPATISSESKRKDSLDSDLKQSLPDRSMPPPSQGVLNVYETRGAREQLNRGYTGDLERRGNRPGVKPRADVDYDVIDDVNALEDGDRPQMYKREDRQRRRASRNTPAEAPSSTSDGLFI
ncbi:hypothetical protein Btru_064675 [Bulinus truncatus]|nr:hypothetical protein Btru_064675 [Bulinus truncatus]